MFGRLLRRDTETRVDAGISFTDWAKLFRPGGNVTFGGQRYQAYSLSSGGAGFYDANSVVFACEMNRLLLFSEARFQFQQLRGGRPGDLFGNEDLGVLEEPWPGATTRDLLVQAELDVACYGNSYWVNDGPYLLRLDPAKISVLTVGAFDTQVTGYQVGEKLGGYVYRQTPQSPPVFYDPTGITHYKPIPSRSNRFVGMSWLDPCLPDADSDDAITEHKRMHLRRGATIPFAVSFDKDVTPDQFAAFVEQYRAAHEGVDNSGKVLFLGAGADIKTVGQTFEQLALKATQGAGETRIAACAGVPPVIVGLSEGLEAATYSNYSQARRRLVDGTMRPLWGAFASALQSVVPIPTASRLWYDDRDIPFLREDIKDQAEIKSLEAATIQTLINAGYTPETVVQAVTSGDYARLKHTGLFSVQLQPPGTGQKALSAAPAALPAGN